MKNKLQFNGLNFKYPRPSIYRVDYTKGTGEDKQYVVSVISNHPDYITVYAYSTPEQKGGIKSLIKARINSFSEYEA